jgi:hypothetical protein
MPGWRKPKVLTEDEKGKASAAKFEDRRDTAQARGKAERVQKAAEDERHKEEKNDRQRRHCAENGEEPTDQGVVWFLTQIPRKESRDTEAAGTLLDMIHSLYFSHLRIHGFISRRRHYRHPS